MSDREVEPWLRGTLMEIDPVRRQVLHALEQASEDAERWCIGLSAEQINAKPAGVAPVAFHLRHIARSLDRLLTYAVGRQLNVLQLEELRCEMELSETPLAECLAALHDAMIRIREIAPNQYEQACTVGRAGLPATVAGLLIHCAEHTQRHIGQAITTAKIVAARTAEAHRS